MKKRKPPKGRNMVAKALQCKIFAPKTVPAKRGKGTIYKREKIKDQGNQSPDPFFI
jgi:hypothetical protein